LREDTGVGQWVILILVVSNNARNCHQPLQQTQPLLFEMALCGWQNFLLLHWRHSLLKQFSTFRANNSNVSSNDIPIIPGRICMTNLLSSKVACADEPRKSFHTEVPGLQATQCKPGKPAPYYSVRQSTDLLIGKTLSAPRVI